MSNESDEDDDDLEPEKILMRKIYGYEPTDNEARRFRDVIWADPTPEELAKLDEEEKSK